ncbi:MAG: hypothetical protein ACRDL7_13100, partial [Gaiellaceae bacterium]
AHWREKRGAPFYHCNSIVGELYDQVTERVDTERKLGRRQFASVCGRHWNRKGQLLCFFTAKSKAPLYDSYGRIYEHSVASRLELIDEKFRPDDVRPETVLCLEWAAAYRREYDEKVMSLMNRYKIYSEGELMTGCIRKYHRLNKRRQHKLSEEVRRHCCQLKRDTRAAFFKEVHESYNIALQQFENYGEPTDMAHFAGESSTVEEQIWHGLEDVILRNAVNPDCELDNDIRAYVTSLDYHRLSAHAKKLAAACYMVTYSPDLRCPQEVSPPTCVEEEIMVSMGEQLQIVEEQRSDVCALFGFPWVFADIIAMGLSTCCHPREGGPEICAIRLR